MIEQDAIGDEQAIGLAIVRCEVVGSDLADGIGAAGLEWSRFGLRRRCAAVHLRRSRLVDLDRTAAGRDVMASRFQKTQRPGTDDVGGVFRLIERDSDMALGAEVIDLVRRDPVDDRAEPAGIRKVAVMEKETGALVVGIEGVGLDPGGIDAGGAPDDAVNLIPLGEKQFGQVGAVLAGNTSDQSCGHAAAGS